MSIDDDFFDVQEFVKDTEVEKPFDRWITYAGELETDVEGLRKENSILRQAFEILKKE